MIRSEKSFRVFVTSSKYFDHSCLGSQAKYIVLWANRRVNVTCRLKRYLIRFPRSACKTDVNIDRSLLSLLSSVLWTECIVKLDFSFFFTGCETDRRKIVLALSWRSLENYHQILWIFYYPVICTGGDKPMKMKIHEVGILMKKQMQR